MPLEGNQLKGALHRALKAEGAELSKHYRDYKVDELQQAYDALAERGDVPIDVAAHPASALDAGVRVSPGGPVPPSIKLPPVRPKDPTEMAGQRINTHAEDEPLRTDPVTGYIWYQEEVNKPDYPKARARRIQKYTARDTVEHTVRDGRFTETFEIPGDGPEQQVEVKITLPSFQVGKYKDPRLPFMVYVYKDNRGFDLFEVQKFYGGADMVPETVKRKYVENVLCFDIPSVVRAIQAEDRQQQLANQPILVQGGPR